MKYIINTIKFLSVTILPSLIMGWRGEKAMIWSFGVMVGIYFMYLHKKNRNYSEITCRPEDNIHIFDEGKKFCHCLGMSVDGERFYIPIKAQLNKKEGN